MDWLCCFLFLFQPLQLLQELHRWCFHFLDSSLPSHGMNHHLTWVKHLMPIFSTSLALMTCVGVSKHCRDSEIVHTAMHVQDGHQLVRSMLSHCKQPTVVGTREDQRVTLSQCVYKVNTFGDYWL